MKEKQKLTLNIKGRQNQVISEYWKKTPCWSKNPFWEKRKNWATWFPLS